MSEYEPLRSRSLETFVPVDTLFRLSKPGDRESSSHVTTELGNLDDDGASSSSLSESESISSFGRGRFSDALFSSLFSKLSLSLQEDKMGESDRCCEFASRWIHLFKGG
jgi:hypothetical protein